MKLFLKKIISFLLAILMTVSYFPIGAFAFSLEEMEETIEETKKYNQWEGKSAVFVGDSITAGVGTTKPYYEYLDETLGFGSVTTMGVSGSCMSTASNYGTTREPLINRYHKIPSADLIMVFMGTNDYGHETPLGTIDDIEDGTFYGALNVIIPALVAKHTSSKIVFVTSIHRYGYGTSGILGTKLTYDNIPNGVGASLGDYVNALKEVCAKNGVSVINLFEECPIDPTEASVREELIPDGVHPNAEGHKIIAEIMEEHIREYEPIEKELENYRWEVKNNTLESAGEDENSLSLIAGSVEEGKLNSVHYCLSRAIKLYHDRPWVVEWKASGNWSGFLFSENSGNAVSDNRYLYKSYMSGELIALGEYDGAKHQNYGVDADEHIIDFSENHIYCVENRINEDGSNMAYLIVDGIEKGAMNGHYVNGNGDQNIDINWVSGKDFSFSYIGTEKYPLKDGVFEYIAVWENGKPEEKEKTELIQGNKFSPSNNQTNRASSRINYYLEAGTVITLKDRETFQWGCTKTNDENSTNNLGYFPDNGWSDKETATVETDSWVGFVFKYRDETRSFDFSRPLSDFIIIEKPHTHNYENGICVVCGTLNSAPLTTFTTTEEAALYLRSQMIAREPSITLRLNGSATGPEISAILTKALEHTGVPNEGDYIRHNQIGYDSSVVTGEDENGTYTEITYTFNWLTTAEQEAEVDAAVDSVLAELDLWDLTNYEKVKGAYDWITENVQYDFDNEDNDEYQLCHSTYAAIVQKNAVCQGYATLYYRMMLELGVDCRYVRGTAGYVEIEDHAWNIVYLDGKYYNMDPTWDRDLMGHYRMFLCTESNFTEHHSDSEYLTAEWKAKYPMAVVPYVFNVTASGKLSNGMEWVLDGDTGTLTVAGKGAIPSYRYSYAPWYQYRESVKSIVVSEGITEVGERAFYWCTNCTSLTLPESLTAIREYGFNNLRALEYVTLPSNLKTLEFCAFSECVALKEIVIPDSVTSCGSSAFSNCYGLKTAVIGKGLTSIPNSMFFGDKNLEDVTLPEGLKYIGDTAFSDCGLFKFTIPATLTGLGSSVFGGCRRLSEFYVESGNQYYKAVDGVLFTKDGKTLVAYSMGDISSYYYVPAGTEVIARSAFNDSYRLQYIYFPDSLKTIEPYAFAYCESLWAVTFTPNITRIGDSAFRSCVNLYRAMFENPNVILESSVFANCDTMEDITLPANLKEIPNGLFYGSARLNEVTIPKSVTKIGSSAFLDCDSLKTITIPGNVKTIEQQAFDYCNKLETVVMEEGVQKIGWLAFSRSPNLKKVVIPSSVTTIENKSSTDWTFIECPNVVLYVNCGTTANSYAFSRGLAKNVSHPYTNASVVPPTCTTQGYTKNYCRCGTYSYNSNYTSALGHSYSSKVTSPTCTAQGYTTYTCRRCSYSYNANYTSALGHSLVLENYLAPTCTAQGYSGDEVCSVCGTIYYGEVISATGHTEVIDKAVAPTCTETGLTEGKHCSVCNTILVAQTVIKAKGHTEVIDKAIAPTCTETGFTEGKHCSVCNAVLVAQTVVKAKGHTEVIDKEVAPTCTETGLTEGKHCSVCNTILVKQTVVSAKGHTEVIDKAVAPTCTETGLTEGKHCSVCNTILVKQTVVSAKGHTEVIDKAVAPTCTETGLTEGKHCSVCNTILVKQNVVSAKGHTEVIDKAVAPTCTETGLTEGKHCSVCSTILVAQTVVKAKGHTEVIDKAVAPTCTETGLTEGKHCSVCNAILVAQTVVKAKGHTEVIDKAVEATCTETGLTEGKHCSVCNTILVVQTVVKAKGHTEVIDKAVAPTCTETGLTEGKHCSVCSTILVAQTVVKAKGHTEVIDKAIAPTCTGTGLTEGKHCSVCNAVLVAQTVVKAKGHTEVIDKAVAPTCTETGLTEGKHCSVCSTILVVQTVVKAKGHTEVIDKAVAPTCTETGLTEGKHCSVCNAVLVAQTVVKAKGHTEVIDKAVAPTCTETGLTEGKHCSVCNTVLVEQYVVKAKGHVEVVDEAVEATCTETGLTEGKHCSVCSVIIIAQEVVPVSEHVFGEWQITVEPTVTENGEEQRHCENCEFVETRVVPAKGYPMGDINKDEKVNVMDVFYARLVAAKLIETTEEQIALGDVDGDGKITAIDANIIRKFVIKMIDKFPIDR